jgi:hypothetical protein
MIHDKSMETITAYDIYKECVEGKLDPSWKVYIEDFHTFHKRLLDQMLQYYPRHRLYPDNDNLREYTQQNKKAQYKSVNIGKGLATEPADKRGRGRPKKNVDTTPVRASGKVGAITQELLKANSQGRDAMLCGNLTSLTRHIKSN